MGVVLPASLRVIERGGGLEPRRDDSKKCGPLLYISSTDRQQIVYFIVNINSIFCCFREVNSSFSMKIWWSEEYTQKC
jgi:hypothetical protein